MPSWWPKSSSKEKKKREKESFFDSFHRKSKSNSKQLKRRGDDTGSKSQAPSRSPSPSRNVARCQSFSDRPLSQPLPLPSKPKLEKSSRSSIFPPIPKPSCIRSKRNVANLDIATASVSSASSSDSDDVACSSRRSPQATDSDQPLQKINSMNTPSTPNGEPAKKPEIIAAKQALPASPRRRPIMPHLKVPVFFNAPDSSMSSPSRSPMRMFPPYQEVNFLSSGQGSSPGSGYNSGQNSMVGDASGQLFLQPSRGSPEYSPVPSPRMNSPGPSSRVHSGAVTPIHPRAGPTTAEIQSHRLPLPPILTIPRSPGWTDNQTIPGSRWKKGKLLGRGTFGHVYVGYNSDNGKMCAMKEVTLCSDDAKSMECAKQLMQEISLLSRLSHPNIVQYFGSETVGDKLYIYLEYVSGGSIYKILQEYGQLGENAIRSYTQQILSGLAYLHSKNTVHRDIKGANILVDPNGRVKLADFGMAKHIRGQTCPLSFKGSPYWMAPEVIKNSNGCSIAVDVWSLGCTVLEMATTKPPWSQFEGVAAMFKIGNSKDLPVIPDHLSDEGKDFVRLCLQRNPQHRPTASQLLEHSFVKGIPVISPLDPPERIPTVVHSSRYPRPNLTSSDLNAWRNVSCPVSPVSSPIVRQNFASPISSPRTTSGSSTPLTGTGVVNAPMMSGGYGKYQLPARGVSARYDGQSVLADRVSKQLLNRPIKMNPSVDLNPMRNRHCH